MFDFSRQELLEEVGKEGQQKFHNSSVAILGIGALGSVAAELLVRSGVGKVMLLDRDVIEESNLQRQFLFEKNDVGRSKVLRFYIFGN